MRKRKALRLVAIVAALVLLLVNWSNVAIAEDEGTAGIVSAGETPLLPEEGGGEGSEMGTRDVTFGNPVWCTLKTSATVYYAPYGTGCASTGYTLAAGKSVYLYSRDYDYFYVCWYIDNKEMYGYIAMSAINLPSTYSWTQYDVYRPGRCTATTTVLSYAGTANTYHVIGEIYAEENPLMILGKQVNPYNNKTYYFVQYHTEAGLIKRGWVDSTLGTVTITVNYTYNKFYESGPFCFVNHATGKALTWDRNTNYLVQKTKDGSLEQFFIFEKIVNVSSQPGFGYIRILSAADPTMAFTVEDKGYAEGLRIKMVEKVSIDKKQEFMLLPYMIKTEGDPDNPVYPDYSKLLTRSTGEYRSVEVYGGLAAENTKIIQSKFLGNNNQLWEVLRVTSHWDGTFGQHSGSASPVNRKVHYDSSLSNHISFAAVQECVNRWNNAYNLSLQTVIGGSETANNCLATIVSGTIIDSDDDSYAVGFCSPVIWESGGPRSYSVDDSSDYVHEKWFSTRITIDFAKISDYSFEQVKAMICHEIGHSLKLSHTYMRLEYVDSEIIWTVVATPVSIMSQGKTTKGTYTPAGIEIDEYRVARKWDGI
ncbi:MAG: hypothetical protein IKM48_07015 [Clostridia bacterium]|nr:hypothetical protein [Clostridia bacterium]